MTKEELHEEYLRAGSAMAHLYREAINNKRSPIIRMIRSELLEARLRFSEAKKAMELRYFDHDRGEWVEVN